MHHRYVEALENLSAIHSPIGAILIRLAINKKLDSTDRAQLRYLTVLAKSLATVCHVDVRVSGKHSIVATFGSGVRCIQQLQSATGALLAACAQFPIEAALDKPLSIASVCSLTHEICFSLGIEV